MARLSPPSVPSRDKGFGKDVPVVDTTLTGWTQASAAGMATAAEPNAVRTEVAVIGGGFAGALAALKLAHAGLSPVVIDPYDPYPSDFRCEKFSSDQIAGLRALGVLDAFLNDDTYGSDPEALTLCGLRYDRMVNALRQQWPDNVRFLRGKVQEVAASADRQLLTLADGARVDCRLAVLATGPGEKLRADLGLKRTVLSANHSICIGFSLRGAFGFDGLIQRGETPGDGVGYASLFRLAAQDGGELMRVNLFLYDDPKSERVRAFRLSPLAELFRVLPALRAKLMLAQVEGPVEMRVTDLYEVEAAHLDGVVLIGDARRTSCPASGTGISRILDDVRGLGEAAPRWLADDGMGRDKLAAFYADPAVTSSDADRHRRSVNGRMLATRTEWPWRARRWLHAARGLVRPLVGRPRPDASPRFLTGDLVTIAPAQAILATLDDHGRLDGLPFMPEMVPFIGQTLRVHHRADRTCVEGHGIRRMDDAVFLETARCDGSAHDGCQRACLMFWKEAWLRPADAPLIRNDAAERQARLSLLNLVTRDARGYMCQSTQLHAATHDLSRIHLGALLTEVRERELSPIRFVDIVVRSLVNRARQALRLPELGLIVGEKGRKSKGDLDLKPGDWVRIKSVEEVRTSLGPNAKNLGLSFEPEMALSIGQVRQVDTIVERMVHEETGQMVGLTRTVTLKGTYCQGLCSKACPRANPLFWREIWLERVEASQTETPQK